MTGSDFKRLPELSWLLPDGSAAQAGYRLTASDGGDTGRVSHFDSVLVPWPFAPLGSAERVVVRVAVRTDLGESPWSEPGPRLSLGRAVTSSSCGRARADAAGNRVAPAGGRGRQWDVCGRTTGLSSPVT